MIRKFPSQYWNESRLLASQSLVDLHHGRPTESLVNIERSRELLALALCNGDEEMEQKFMESQRRRLREAIVYRTLMEARKLIRTSWSD